MRVIVYVPSVRGLGRVRRAVARDAEAEGWDVQDIQPRTPQEARLAIEAGLADWIVGRPEHLLELVQAAPDLLRWVRQVHPKPRGRSAAVLLAPATVLAVVRKYPGRAAAVGAGVAGAVLAAAVVLGPDDQRAMPSPSASAPVSPPGSAGGSSPDPRSSPSRVPPSSARTSAPARPTTTRPSSPEPGGGGGVAMPTPTPTPRQSSPVPPSPSVTPSPTQPADIDQPQRHCIIRLDLLGIPVRVCLT